jgi:hypothetical protein
MKKIILAAALAAPFALGTAAFAQDAGGFTGAPANDIVTTPATGPASAPREFTARAKRAPLVRAEQVDIQQVPATTGGNS